MTPNPEQELFDAIWAIGREVERLHLRRPAKIEMRRRVAAARQAFCRCFPARVGGQLFRLEMMTNNKQLPHDQSQF